MDCSTPSHDTGQILQHHAVNDFASAAGRRGWSGAQCRPVVDDRALPWRRRPLASGVPSAHAPVERINIAPGSILPEAIHGAVAALGNFDGLHRGHQQVIGCAVAMARARGVAAVIATFDPHPVRYFKPCTTGFALTTLDQRSRMLRALGVDAMLVFAFDDHLARITPAEFVQEWLHGLGGVVTGSNFTFGHRRAGTVATLAALAHDQGMVSDAVCPILSGGKMVSSSRIREALRAGDCAAATRLLTRPFAIEGKLRLSRRANLALPLFVAGLELHGYIRPRSGLYKVRARLDDGRVLSGMARLGAATDAEPVPPLELALAGLSERDLDRRVALELIARRPEMDGSDGTARLPGRLASDRYSAAWPLAQPVAL